MKETGDVSEPESVKG